MVRRKRAPFAAAIFETSAMPKTELDGLPVIEVPDSEITVAVKPDDLQHNDEAIPRSTRCYRAPPAAWRR